MSSLGVQVTLTDSALYLFNEYTIYRIPEGSDAALVVTQFYEFRKLDDSAVEPARLIEAAEFRLQVKYEYFPLGSGQNLISITIPQRLHFRVHPDRSEMPPPYNSAALVLDGDSLFSGPPPVSSPFGNPMLEEVHTRAFEDGQEHIEHDSVDNYHQTHEPYIQLPDPDRFVPGCPNCVHIHWRWGHLANTLLLGTPGFTDGLPIVPPGSHQSLDIAVVQYKSPALDPDAEEEDPIDYAKLVNGEPLGGKHPLLPQQNYYPVLWYVGTGYQNEDSFFYHYGFFAPPE
jgi:hypothetical protein